MSESRNQMIVALKDTVVPALRELGFSGSFPHFRRPSGDRIDLLSFQFDRWGGGFVIEISKCPKSGITTHWGDTIPANQVRAIDLHPDNRYRIKPGRGGSTADWFRFDQQSPFPSPRRFARVAHSVLPYLDEAQKWWDRRDDSREGRKG